MASFGTTRLILCVWMEQWLGLPAFASRVSILGWSSIGNKSRWMVEHLGNLDGVLYGDCHRLAILKHSKFSNTLVV
jgi:hypothetical protein